MWSFAASVCASLLVSTAAHANDRHFTGALDLGGGVTQLTSAANNNPGLGTAGPGYGLLLGWFVTHDLAIAAHSIVEFTPASMDERLAKTGASVIVSSVVQWWPSAHFNVIGGIGYGLVVYQRRDPQTVNQAVTPVDGGFVPLVGAAYTPAYGARIALEVAPLLSLDGVKGVVSTASIGWQYAP